MRMSIFTKKNVPLWLCIAIRHGLSVIAESIMTAAFQKLETAGPPHHAGVKKNRLNTYTAIRNLSLIT
jgi:hypothetical protein